jgi:hypothetical protein
MLTVLKPLRHNVLGRVRYVVFLVNVAPKPCRDARIGKKFKKCDHSEIRAWVTDGALHLTNHIWQIKWGIFGRHQQVSTPVTHY